MGEIADGLINGDFDSITGEYLGEGQGFPRSLHWSKKQTKRKQIGTFDENTRVVWDFLSQKGVVSDSSKSQIVKVYGIELEPNLTKTSEICARIRESKESWKAFKNWGPVKLLNKKLK